MPTLVDEHGPKKAIPDKPGKSNWVEKAGGLPSYIKRIAEHLHGKGHSVSSSIAIAVGTVKRWARGGGEVSAKTRAKAAKAVAEWEAKKAKAKVTEAAYDDDARALTAEELADLAVVLSAELAVEEARLPRVTGPKRREVAASIVELRSLVEAATYTGIHPPREKRPKPPERKDRNGDASNPEFERLHPRQPKGRVGGGQFAVKGDGYGDEGPKRVVSDLQRRLRELGFHVEVDGQFGPATEAGVKAFQRKYGLTPSGKVDAATTTLLRQPPEQSVEDVQREQVIAQRDRQAAKRQAEVEAGIAEPKKLNATDKGAVEQFQRQHGLDPDGIAGAKTQAAMRKYGYEAEGSESGAAKPSSSSSSSSASKSGSKSGSKKASTDLSNGDLKKGEGMGEKADPAVKALQTILDALGFDLGEAGVDGRFGPDTQVAVKALQRKYGLRADGIVGRQTKALLERLAKKQAKAQKSGNIESEVKGSVKMQEAYNRLQPRDRLGRWRDDLAAMKPGQSKMVGGVRVRRQTSGDWDVDGDRNLASPDVAVASVQSKAARSGNDFSGEAKADPMLTTMKVGEERTVTGIKVRRERGGFAVEVAPGKWDRHLDSPGVAQQSIDSARRRLREADYAYTNQPGHNVDGATPQGNDLRLKDSRTKDDTWTVDGNKDLRLRDHRSEGDDTWRLDLASHALADSREVAPAVLKMLRRKVQEAAEERKKALQEGAVPYRMALDRERELRADVVLIEEAMAHVAGRGGGRGWTSLDEKLHPRDRIGRWREVWARMRAKSKDRADRIAAELAAENFGDEWRLMFKGMEKGDSKVPPLRSTRPDAKPHWRPLKGEEPLTIAGRRVQWGVTADGRQTYIDLDKDMILTDAEVDELYRQRDRMPASDPLPAKVRARLNSMKKGS